MNKPLKSIEMFIKNSALKFRLTQISKIIDLSITSLYIPCKIFQTYQYLSEILHIGHHIKLMWRLKVWRLNLASLRSFTFFLSGLSHLHYSAIFKICHCFLKYSFNTSKNIVSKNKANYQLMLSLHKDKNHPENCTINATKFSFK